MLHSILLDSRRRKTDQWCKKHYANDSEIYLVATQYLAEKLTSKRQCSGGSGNLVCTCCGDTSVKDRTLFFMSLASRIKKRLVLLGTMSHRLWENVHLSFKWCLLMSEQLACTTCSLPCCTFHIPIYQYSILNGLVATSITVLSSLRGV